MKYPLANRGALPRANTVVVKVGSSSLTGPGGSIDLGAIDTLVDTIARRWKAGQRVALVSSGAIATGMAPLGLRAKPRDLATAQAAASAGQGLLVAHYTRSFARYGLHVGQVLLSADDLIRRQHYVNARRAVKKLLDLGVVPIINENDTVATNEIRFGDNDRLAALVAHLVRADALVLLTDVEGLYDGPPDMPGTSLVRTVHSSSDLEGIRIGSRGSAVGTGGMVTKVDAAKMATSAGIPVLLAKADTAHAALEGQEVGTWFSATARKTTARKMWLAYATQSHGRIFIDDGAVGAIVERGRSLLAPGITAASGDFHAGDPVDIAAPGGRIIARGLCYYDASTLDRMLREPGCAVEQTSRENTKPVVHRDDMVILEGLSAG